MRISLELAPTKPLRRLMGYAALAEKLGYNAVWVSEHYFNRNSTVLLTMIATSTERIQFGHGVLNPYLTHPAVMAQLAATFCELFGDRVLLGIGAGDALTLETLGVKREAPLRRVAEAVRTVRDMVRGEKVNEFMRLGFSSETVPRIYIGAQSPKMLELAGSIADGVLINTTELDLLGESIKSVIKGLTSSGRRREDVAIEAALTVAIGDEKAKKIVVPYAATIASSLSDSVLERAGLNEVERARLRSLVKMGLWFKLFEESFIDRLVENFTISGDESHVFNSIESIMSYGLDGVVFGGPLGIDQRAAIELIARRYL
ncbi:MAG: LLM class flavin-dependent oxidoreductase [Aigarchaeota archaeon]|nr:LLM class flavin-dependent oxidoreductase [Aigarchaeota archaeon]MDW8092755.1 LLM class flavin-dependent oxidoreductase [Nitrososphaerota archaeon]